VIKVKENKEQLEEKIFNLFSKFRNESASDRRQVYLGQLWELIYKWCMINKNYDMGEEIGIFIIRITKETSKANIPQNKDDFFNYLYSSLKIEKAGYYRKYEAGMIHIPNDKISKLKKIENAIREEENRLERKMTINECSQLIQERFNINNSEYQKYLDLYNKKYIGSLQFISHNDNEENDLLNSTKASSCSKNISNDPLDEYFLKLNDKKKKDILEHVLINTQDRTREKDRALYTVYCINNSIDFEGLTSLLNKEIVETFIQSKKKPLQYEVFLKYHDGKKGSITKESAEAMASERLKIFLEKLEKASQ